MKGNRDLVGNDPKRWRNEVDARRRQLLVEMMGLADATKSVPQRLIYLDLYRRGDRGSVTLRWRDAKGRGLTWEVLNGLLAQWPESMARQYRECQSEVLRLNAQEQIFRMTDAVLVKWLAELDKLGWR